MPEWSNQSTDLSTQLSEWFATPLGQYLLDVETRWFARTLPDLHGWTAVQVGMPCVNLLASSHARQRWMAGDGAGVQVVLDPTALPFGSSTVDVLVLPHVLDFSPYPHQVLREAQRVLVPEGKLLISGFNPWSLWGMRRLLSQRHSPPWTANFISLPRIKDWLELLSLPIRVSGMGCYIPAAKQPKWQARWQFMESAGDRWWPAAGAVYFLQASKHVFGMRLTGRVPAKARRVRPQLIPVSRDSVTETMSQRNPPQS